VLTARISFFKKHWNLFLLSFITIYSGFINNKTD
jgi:hypothetical protein